MSRRVLIVDDEDNIRNFLKISFEKNGHHVYVSKSVEEALKTIKSHYIDLVITDFKLPGKDGMYLISEISKIQEAPYLIMMTAYGDVNVAVKAMKAGANDFIAKPFEFEELMTKAENAFSLMELKDQRDLLLKKDEEKNKYHDIIGKSKAMQTVYELIKKVAPLPSTVLITGETGTGKELVAKAIHKNSLRAERPFIAINCTTFTETLLESELFGYEKGAFTDAKTMRKGLFELADKGTILFDEIGDMPINLQAKLLRVIQDKKIRRIGGAQDIDIDVRILSATNKDLSQLIEQGSFRDDLFFRLNVFPIELPPLRSRDLDITLLSDHFVRQFSEEFGKDIKGIHPLAKEKLLKYSWPGNIRELKNMIERIAIMSQHDVITVNDLPIFLQNQEKTSYGEISFQDAKKDLINNFEKDYIVQKLIETNGNVKLAAEMSGLDRTVLQRYLKNHQIDSTDFKK